MFHGLPSRGYLVTAEDRKTDKRTEKPEGRMDNAKPISLPLHGRYKTNIRMLTARRFVVIVMLKYQ